MTTAGPSSFLGHHRPRLPVQCSVAPTGTFPIVKCRKSEPRGSLGPGSPWGGGGVGWGGVGWGGVGWGGGSDSHLILGGGGGLPNPTVRIHAVVTHLHGTLTAAAVNHRRANVPQGGSLCAAPGHAGMCVAGCHTAKPWLARMLQIHACQAAKVAVGVPS